MKMKCPVCGAKYDDVGLENAKCGECLMRDVKMVPLVPDVEEPPAIVGNNIDHVSLGNFGGEGM